MRIGLLGPLQVEDGDLDITPTAPKQRRLFALLALNANRVVSIELCVQELWDGHPPAGAAATIRVHMAQLRKTLSGGPSRARQLTSHGRGYLLTAGPGDIDLGVFNALVRRARAARADGLLVGSAELFGLAFQRWRAAVLVDVMPGSATVVAREALLRHYMDILYERIDVDLELGRHRLWCGELGTLTRRHPTESGLHERLMIALYRSGRQVDALGVYQHLNRYLRIEYGIEPSDELNRLHADILASAPGLEGPDMGIVLALDLAAKRRSRAIPG